VFERLLELTRQQHGLKFQIDKLRAGADEFARARWQAEKDRAPKWEIAGLGAIRLDNTNGETTPAVTDAAEFASYVAERYPHEAVATITVPAGQLEAALEALGFAEVKVDKAEVAVRPAFQTRILGDVELAQDEPEEEGGEKPPHYGVLIDKESGNVERVPGIGANIALPKLVVTVSNEAKAEATVAAKAALAELETTPATTEEA
jgi:hypothetical protein